MSTINPDEQHRLNTLADDIEALIPVIGRDLIIASVDITVDVIRALANGD